MFLKKKKKTPLGKAYILVSIVTYNLLALMGIGMREFVYELGLRPKQVIKFNLNLIFLLNTRPKDEMSTSGYI